MPIALTIAEAAQSSGLTAYTLRYYEQIGLIDPVPRRSGQRVYGDAEMRLITFVQCLRATGMPMRDIQEYMRLRRLGDTQESIRLRGELLGHHAAHLRNELVLLTETIERLDAKIARYHARYESDVPPVASCQTTGTSPSKRRRNA
ncbi:MerR family transcriptional regulator [Luteibacter anthropi]|uniref:MerR family transcriptional regulator n=1 Tax=Luteibacter anthropi TaxID=564369 RepID=UPI0020326E92|nr:MerR family transcriptional regulator [Luteibacter anthropi]URX63471.1 MerR family transcriptional regulator [Luteibacter anthropi]